LLIFTLGSDYLDSFVFIFFSGASPAFTSQSSVS
jgi:hypothetical protein